MDCGRAWFVVVLGCFVRQRAVCEQSVYLFYETQVMYFYQAF